MNLTDLLSTHGVTFRVAGESPHVTPGWIGIECPFCGRGTGKFGMGLRPDSRVASCWKCGSWKLGDVLAEVVPLPKHKLRELLKGLDFRRAPPRGLKRGKLALPKGVGPMLPAHRQYLKRRGFNPDEIARLWNVGGIGIAARLQWRLFVPNVQGGRTVSWTTRALSDEGTRYVAARPDEEEWPAKSLLYGADYAGHAVVVHEGPTDVWRTGPGAVALMGTGYSRAQVQLLSTYPVRVVCFDNETQAQRRAGMLCDDLSVFPGKTMRVTLDAEDPGSAGAKEIRQLRKLLE